jgi:hypothetical protein
MRHVLTRSSTLLLAIASLHTQHALAQSCDWQWVQLDLPVSPSPRFEGFFGGDRIGELSVAGVLFGGVGPNSRLNDTWYWRRATSADKRPRWEQATTTNTPPPLGNGAVATDPTGVVGGFQVFGGLAQTSQGLALSPVWYSLNTVSNSWVIVTSSLEPRWNQAAAYVSGTIVHYAGATSLLPNSLLSNTGTAVFTPSFTVPPASLQGVYALSGAPFSLNEAVFPFGDRRATTSSPYTTNFAVPKLQRVAGNNVGVWQILSWPMQPRANYALTSHQRGSQALYDLVLFGGDEGTFPDATTLRNDTWIFSGATESFTQVQGQLPSPRRARNQLIYDRTRDMYVLFGGHNGSYLNDTWVLSRTPVLRDQTTSLAHCPGATLTLSVDVGWQSPLTYRWLQNGVPLSITANPSAATNTLVIPNYTAVAASTFICEYRPSCSQTPFLSHGIVVAPALPTACVACDTIDFNADTLFPDDADLVDFLSVLAGGACSTNACNDIDFNNDGLFPDDADLIAFLNVLAGGDCL